MNNLFKNKRVLVFGLGLNQGGVGSAKFFAKQGAKVRVTDLKTKEVLKPSLDLLKDFPNIEYTLGKHKYEDFDWADLIIKNPAVKPGNSYIEYARKIGKQVEMDMGIFLQFVKPSQIIGVTGTKGKSTTASLIYEVLKRITHKKYQKSAGVNINTPQGCLLKKVVLAGNIGESVLDIMDQVDEKTLIVLEISSFQLEAFETHKVSPKYAVITNIYPDHLNYYKNMDEYHAAKKVIGKYQTEEDFLFINKDDQTINNPKFLKRLNGQQVLYSSSDLPKNFHPFLEGEHNLSNMAAAFAVGKTFGVEEQTIIQAISNFRGVPFRMELIKEWGGVKIINDTTATGPDAAIQAIKTASHIGSGNVILICGGMNKNLDYTQFVTIVKKCVKEIYPLQGDATDAILSLLQIPESNLKIHQPYNNLKKLLEDVKAEVKPGDIILFSPAATSFNLFQNEFDRGRKFNEAVEKLFG